MRIRQATENELLSLWRDPRNQMRPTTRFFVDNIKSGNATFWTYDNDGELVGELYVFRSLDDRDFADGCDRAYLCAFRIRPEFQGKGFGTGLFTHVIEKLGEEGFSSVTIGVLEEEEPNVRLYRKLGFTKIVKTCSVDPCDIGADMRPVECEEYVLLKRDL